MNWNHTCGAKGLWWARAASEQMDHGEDLLWWNMKVKHSSLLCHWEYLRSEVTVEFYHCLQGGEHWIMMLLWPAQSHTGQRQIEILTYIVWNSYKFADICKHWGIISVFFQHSTAQRRIFISSTSHPRTLMLAQLSFSLLMPCVYVCIHTRVLAILCNRRQGEVHYFPLTRLYPECKENRKRGAMLIIRWPTAANHTHHAS